MVISSRATHSCSGCTPSTPDNGKRTAKAWRPSRAPNGRSRLTNSVPGVRTHSDGPQIGWSSTIRRSRSASRSSISSGIQTASRFWSSRARALTTLRQINSQMNPFRVVVYSEWSGQASRLCRRNNRPSHGLGAPVRGRRPTPQLRAGCGARRRSLLPALFSELRAAASGSLAECLPKGNVETCAGYRSGASDNYRRRHPSHSRPSCTRHISIRAFPLSFSVSSRLPEPY